MNITEYEQLIFLCVYWQTEIENMLKKQDYEGWSFALEQHTKASNKLLDYRYEQLYYLYYFQLN